MAQLGNVTPTEQILLLVEEFELEWKRTLNVVSPPEIDSFLQMAGTEASAEVRRALEAIDHEYRRGRSIYKLRFRRDGRQVARHLGTDPFTAAAIASELHAWQSERRQFLELRRLDAQARRLLRETKLRLEQDLLSFGYHFHGLEIRAIKTNRTTRRRAQKRR